MGNPNDVAPSLESQLKSNMLSDRIREAEDKVAHSLPKSAVLFESDKERKEAHRLRTAKNVKLNTLGPRIENQEKPLWSDYTADSQYAKQSRVRVKDRVSICCE